MVRRQQWMCRTVFVLFGILPLCVVLAAQLYRNAAANADHWRIAAQTRIGMGVEVEEVEFPRPGVVRLHGVTLMHPETGLHALRCNTIMHTTDRDGMHLEIDSATLQTAHWDVLRQTLFQRLLKQPKLHDGPARVTIQQLKLAGPRLEPNEAEDVNLRLWRNDESMHAHLDFRWKGRPDEDRVEIGLARYSPDAETPTRIDILTGSIPLPCDILIGPELDPHGRLARITFQGNLWIKPVDTGWKAHFHGALDSIDLRDWVSQVCDMKLTGSAAVSVNEAAVENGRLTKLRAIVRSAEGEVDGKLLRSAEQNLNWQVQWPTGDDVNVSNPADRSAPWAYRDLVLHVALSAEDGLQLKGQNASLDPSLNSEIVASLPENGFIRTRHADRLSPTALLRTLLPDDPHVVPVNDALKSFMFALPLEK
jgi:hypothetical protein